MEKLLLSNNLVCTISQRQKLVIDIITKEIFNSIFGSLYQEEDIYCIRFNHKGLSKTTALYICITLNFKEPQDIIDDIKYKLKNEVWITNEGDPGLSFISVFPNGIIGNQTEYTFWYQLSEDELNYF
jgi:hypothetical protein